MSVAHRHVEIGAASGATTRAAAEVVIRWSVAADAVGAGTRGTVVIEMVVERDGAGLVRVEGVLVSPMERRVVHGPRIFEAGAWRSDETGLEHIEAGTALRATLGRTPDGTAQVLFAQTDVLGALGIGGGRYDRPR